MRGIGLFLPLVLLFSCDDPERRLHRLQRDFFRVFPDSAFVLVSKKDTVRLGLPPTEEELKRLRAFALKVQPEMERLDPSAFSDRDYRAYERLRGVVDSAAAGGFTVLFHEPGTGFVPFYLNRGLPAAVLVSLVDTLPAYYATVQRRWKNLGWSYTYDANQTALSALDKLNNLEKEVEKMPAPYRERLLAALPAARRAVKDYIGFLQSKLMLE